MSTACCRPLRNALSDVLPTALLILAVAGCGAGEARPSTESTGGSGGKPPQEAEEQTFESESDDDPEATERYWTEERMKQARPYPMPGRMPPTAQQISSRSRRLNLIVITIDTLRADALGIYGSPHGNSPHIDAFARDAIVFDDAVTTIGTTIPAHATIFTGLYPKNHGVMWNGDALDDRITTLAEILSAAGYDTAAFVAWGSMLSRGGLHQGIATLSDPPDSGPAPAVRDGDEVNDLARSWLATRRDKPFFLWLHYYEPHAPYRLTESARERLAGYDGPLAAGASIRTFYSLGKEIPWTPEERRALRALYDGEVCEVDRLVGEVLDLPPLRESSSETIVMITADHGQALGERGQIGHGFLLSQPVLHVPLIVRVPGIAPKRVRGRVGLIDQTPFLLDVLGLPVPPGLDGASLIELLHGAPPSGRRYFAEVRQLGTRFDQIRARNDDEPERRAKSLLRALEQDPGSVAVFEDDVKGVWSDGEFRVYDLARDPRELYPRKPDPGDSKLNALRELALDYHDREPIARSRTEFHDAVREELKSLGYIQ